MKAVNGETLLIKTPVDVVRGKEIGKITHCISQENKG